MKSEFLIGRTPAALYHAEAERAFLYIHGQGGNKEEAARFQEVAARFGYATLAVDLPEHGGRRDGVKLLPWEVARELREVLHYAREHYRTLALRTVSIGTWFSLVSFSGESFEMCLFSSPLVDMEDMIVSLMQLSGADEERLRKEREIPTRVGQTLSWDYLTYVREHPVGKLSGQTAILYATADEIIRRETVERYASLSGAELCLYPGGQHYLHTPEEIAFMESWEARVLSHCTKMQK